MSQDSQSAQELSLSYEFQVPFYDLDGIQMVWHGNYVKYMEDGRESFGEQYGLEYLTMFNNGYTAPIVDMKLQFKQSVSVGETVIVETTYRPCRSAKLIFDYVIYNKKDMSVVNGHVQNVGN